MAIFLDTAYFAVSGISALRRCYIGSVFSLSILAFKSDLKILFFQYQLN